MPSFLLPLEVPSTSAALRDAGSESAESRWVAAMALGRVDGEMRETATQALFELTTDEVGEVRAQAVEGLLEQRLRGASVSSGFVKGALEDVAPCVRCAAIDAAAVFIEESEEVISKLLKDDDPSVRATAVSALGLLGGTAKKDDIAALIDDENDYVANEAAIALAKLGDGRGEARLISALKGDTKTALDAALALGKLGLETSAPVLRQVAKRTFASRELKAMAAAALVSCSDTGGLLILEDMLGAMRQSTRMVALTVLARLPVKGIEDAVSNIAESEDGMESSAAKEVLKEIELEKTKPGSPRLSSSSSSR